MARNKKLGILTGGGDVPGLNPAIKAVVEAAIDRGWDVIGVRRGWGGLLYCNLESPQPQKNLFVSLTKNVVRTIDRTGGTFLHTSRTNPQRVRSADMPDFLEGTVQPIEGEGAGAIYDFTPHILKVLEFQEVDALVAIGGDDTLSYPENNGQRCLWHRLLYRLFDGCNA
jgi:6-phosphofructokinase